MNFKVMGISNAMDMKEDSSMKKYAIGTVYVAQDGSLKF
jgi:hypothetical protein